MDVVATPSADLIVAGHACTLVFQVMDIHGLDSCIGIFMQAQYLLFGAFMQAQYHWAGKSQIFQPVYVPTSVQISVQTSRSELVCT